MFHLVCIQANAKADDNHFKRGPSRSISGGAMKSILVGNNAAKKKTRKVISGFRLHLHLGIHDTLLRFLHCILSCTQDNRAFANSVLEMIVLLS